LIKGARSFTLDYIMVERVVVGPWKTNCYIYSSTKKECIIIDPGGSDEEIASRVDVLNMVPIGIALTHGHVDHLAALRALRDGYAARGYKLPIAINTADRKFLGSGGIETHRENLEFLGLDEATFFGLDEEELPKADVRLREGDRVFDMDLVVLETPGHTPGSVCFYSEREAVLFSGDTLFFDNVGRSDMAGGSEKKLRESIQKKIAILPPETRVFPGHGPFTTVEREKRGNPYFRGMVQPASVPGPSLFPQKLAAVQNAGVPKGAAQKAGAQKTARKASPAPHHGAGKAVKKPAAATARAGKRPPARDRPSAVRVARAAATNTRARAATASGSRAGAKRPPAAAKKSTLKVRRSLPVSRGRQVSRSVAGKKAKARPSAVRAQATRSTKAPGAGRKPAR
jgi:hydroxyacylglutathione hydrolase